MIKRFNSLFHFMKEMPNLKDYIVVFPPDIEEQFMMLKTYQTKKIKNDMKRLNIRMIIERDMYEIKSNNKKHI